MMQTKMASRVPLDLVKEREIALNDWLAEHAPECCEGQRHLDDGADERAYWHYGYLVALRDVLALLEGNASTLRH